MGQAAPRAKAAVDPDEKTWLPWLLLGLAFMFWRNDIRLMRVGSISVSLSSVLLLAGIYMLWPKSPRKSAVVRPIAQRPRKSSGMGFFAMTGVLLAIIAGLGFVFVMMLAPSQTTFSAPYPTPLVGTSSHARPARTTVQARSAMAQLDPMIRRLTDGIKISAAAVESATTSQVQAALKNLESKDVVAVSRQGVAELQASMRTLRDELQRRQAEARRSGLLFKSNETAWDTKTRSGR